MRGIKQGTGDKSGEKHPAKVDIPKQAKVGQDKGVRPATKTKKGK